MNVTHTPGPWKINTDGELEINGHSTRTDAADFSNGVIDYPEAFANLTLAASAPGLLSVAKSCLALIKTLPHEGQSHLKDTLLDAIAKAEGRV